jgi:hypothetical protein
MQIVYVLLGDLQRLPVPRSRLPALHAFAPISPESHHVIYAPMIHLAETEKFRLIGP